jgi:hypothetical protein
MGSDRPLKSAYELALERLRAQDKEQGVQETKPLTRQQKDEIARLRENAQAKLAELEILHRKHRVEAAGDPEKLQQVEQHYQIDRQRVDSALESRIARVRRGQPAEQD